MCSLDANPDESLLASEGSRFSVLLEIFVWIFRVRTCLGKIVWDARGFERGGDGKSLNVSEIA